MDEPRNMSARRKYAMLIGVSQPWISHVPAPERLEDTRLRWMTPNALEQFEILLKILLGSRFVVNLIEANVDRFLPIIVVEALAFVYSNYHPEETCRDREFCIFVCYNYLIMFTCIIVWLCVAPILQGAGNIRRCSAIANHKQINRQFYTSRRNRMNISFCSTHLPH